MNINKLETELIKPVYHKPEPDVMAEPIQGYVNEGNRSTYTKEESANASQTVKGDKTKFPVYSGSSTVA